MWVSNALALMETHLYDLVSHQLKIFQVLCWHYILNYVILLNCSSYCYLICLNFMDIQLVVERRKRPQIQILVLTGTLLKWYQNYGTIWLEIFWLTGWNHQYEKHYYQKTSGSKRSIEGNYCKLTTQSHNSWNSDEFCGAIRSKK